MRGVGEQGRGERQFTRLLVAIDGDDHAPVRQLPLPEVDLHALGGLLHPSPRGYLRFQHGPKVPDLAHGLLQSGPCLGHVGNREKGASSLAPPPPGQATAPVGNRHEGVGAQHRRARLELLRNQVSLLLLVVAVDNRHLRRVRADELAVPVVVGRHVRRVAVVHTPVDIVAMVIRGHQVGLGHGDDHRMERIERLDQLIECPELVGRHILVAEIRLVKEVPGKERRVPSEGADALGDELLVPRLQPGAVEADERLQAMLLRLIQILQGTLVAPGAIPGVVVDEVVACRGHLRHILAAHTIHAEEEVWLAVDGDPAALQPLLFYHARHPVEEQPA